MKNRLKENIMLIVLCIVIIRCTVSINNRLDESNGALGGINYDTSYRVSDIYSLLLRIDTTLDSINNDTLDIVADTERIRQDIDDIGYKLGI